MRTGVGQRFEGQIVCEMTFGQLSHVGAHALSIIFRKLQQSAHRINSEASSRLARHDAGDLGAVPLADPTEGVQQPDNRVFAR